MPVVPVTLCVLCAICGSISLSAFSLYQLLIGVHRCSSVFIGGKFSFPCPALSPWITVHHWPNLFFLSS
jgi:hypothetical protein